MKKLGAVVVGLGQIGQGYDYDDADGELTVTHATGFASHDAYELLAAVDPDPAQRQRFERKFERPAYPDLPGMLSTHRPEVVSIAVPTPLHYPVFKEVVGCHPRAVLCEKPIASQAVDARQMLALAEEKRLPLLVNYMRRFEPGVLALKQAIRDQQIGDIYKGTVWYSKGLLNNGSHFVDMLRFLIGEVSDFRVLSAGRRWDGDDPEPDVGIRFGGASIYFLAGREERFTMGEVELIGTLGTVRYLEGGAVIQMRRTRPDPTFEGYSILDEAEAIPSQIDRYQWHTLEHLKRHLTHSEPLASNGDTATETLEVVERIHEQLAVTAS